MFEIQVSDSIRKEISSKGIPFGLWDKYRSKYKYRFVINSYDDKEMLTFESIDYLNGESTIFYEKDLVKNPYVTAPLPNNGYISLNGYTCNIEFNDKEIMNVFEKLSKNHPNQPIDIVLTPKFNYDDIKLSVKCEEEEIPLSQSKVVQIWGGE